MRLKRVVSANLDHTSWAGPRHAGVLFLTSSRAARLCLWLGLGACGAVGIGCGGGAPKPAAESALDERIEEPPPQRKAPGASPLVKEAEGLLGKGDHAGAKAKFEAAIAENPEDPRAYLGLGLCEEALEQVAAAEKAYRKAVELDPNLAEAHNNLGLLLRDKDDLEGAIAALTRATEADPRLASAQANLAMALEDAQRPEQAGPAYAKAVKLAGDDAMLRANYGLFLLQQGQKDAAADQLLAGLAGAKGDRAALLYIGNGLRRAERPDAAVRAVREAIAGGDGKPTPALLAELSLAQNAAKDDAGAKASLEEALKLDPKYATAHYLLGSVLAGQGDFKAAAVHYKKCIELDPKGELAKKAKEKLEAAQQAGKKK
jgi:Tfp pilus assembly protein PilF